MSAQTAAEAVVAHLETAGLTVYDTEAGVKFDGSKEVPKGNYAVLHLAPGLRTSEGLCNTADRDDLDFQVTCVGASPRGCRWVAARMETLAPRVLSVDGAEALVTQVGSTPIRRDTDRPDVTVFYGTGSFTILTNV